MRRKKYLSTIFIVTLLVLSFLVIFAAGNGGEKEAVIRVWKGPHTPDDNAVFADVIAAFESENPGAMIPTIRGAIRIPTTTVATSKIDSSLTADRAILKASSRP